MQSRHFYTDNVKSLKLHLALEGYYLVNPAFTHYSRLKTERARRLVRAHDIAHIVFGCATDDEGEMAVQLWTKYGADTRMPMLEKARYIFEPEALKLVLNVDAVKFSIARRDDVKKLSSTITSRAKNMIGKWRYFHEDPYLDMTVGDIRGQLNIQTL